MDTRRRTERTPRARRPALLLCLGLVVGTTWASLSATHAQRTRRATPPAGQVGRLAPRIEVAELVGSPRMHNPAVLVSNLDAGDLVAGRSWLRVGEIIFVETFIGFLWSPDASTRSFEVPLDIYLQENIQQPRDISDNGLVVGVDWFTATGLRLPFQWTQASGFEFLLTAGAGWIGPAEHVSADGTIIGGWLQLGPAGTPNAARWVVGVFEFLPTSAPYSKVGDISASGSVLVGEQGADAETTTAVRWVNGMLAPLDGVPGETQSRALLSSDDGEVALGTAAVGGRNLLVRWDAQGTATVHAPPAGFSIVSLNATTPTGTTVVGELTSGTDWKPFVWRASSGFQLLGELGRDADYDRSRAVGVSDDGRRVIGTVSASSTVNGDPPSTAVLWVGSRTIVIDDLLEAGGLRRRGLFTGHAISGDGRRLLATGLQGPLLADSGAVLITLRGGLRTR